MTTLDVTLSAGFQQEVTTNPSLYVYAIAYDSNDATGVITTLAAGGAVESANGVLAVGLLNPTIPGDTSFNGGKVYFVVESSGTVPDIATQISQQSDLNLGNAQANHFVYDSMEMTLSNQGPDAANLTSVNGFALPMELSVPYSNGSTATAGYNVSGQSLIQALQTNEGGGTSDIAQFLPGTIGSLFQMAIAPAAVISAATPNPSNVTFQATNWASYALAVGTMAQTADILLSGFFDGTSDQNNIYHNGGYFAYQVKFAPTATLVVGGTVDTGVFMLVPVDASEIKGVIAVSATQLEESIYSTLGTAEIFNSTAEVLGGAAPAYTIGTGANDQWGTVLRSLLMGFTAGYYGETARSVNPQVTATIDLNNSINWDPTYAFGSGTLNQNGTVTNLVTSDVTVPAGQVSHDPYAQVFYQHSNSYGSGYTDALMSEYSVGGPLVSVYDTATTSDVATVDLTLYAPNEQPSGYTTPQIANYIAPGANGYGVPDATPATIDVGMNFAASVGNSAGVMLNASDVVTLDIMTADTGGVAQWGSVTLDGAANGGLWQQWVISGNSTTGYTATPGATSGTAGYLQIDDFPVVGTGTATSWYRIGIGTKTFDLYTVTQNGNFDNTTYSSGGVNQRGSLAIDGLASVTPQQSTAPTVPTFTINFASGAGVAVDPSQVVVNPAAPATQPDAPVAGLIVNGTFEALAGQTQQVSNTIATTIAAPTLAVAFGWTGLNGDSSTPSWISGYTNKVDAFDTVEVTITPVGDVTHPLYATATANLDGEWQTGMVALGAGTTYDVTMAAYQASVSGPVTQQSHALVLDVACFAAGTRILTARGEVAVEALAVGDLVWSRGGGLTPVRWLGRRHIDCRLHARPRDVAPVRVLAGALAPGVPHRDLLLSPDHAVFVEGVLIPVRYLVNGRTVRREAVDAVTYHHVELAAHDVILAEGLACESYLDTGNRAIFENARGMKADAAFALAVWEAGACAPLVLKGKELVAARRLLLARAEELGLALTREPALRVVAGGRVLHPRRSGRMARFRLPEAARDVRLVSRSAVPAQTSAAAEDHRRLGVAVGGIRFDGETIGLLDARLGRGWHGVEQGAAGEAWRWTDGEASLALAGGGVLDVEVALTESYWRDEAPPSG